MAWTKRFAPQIVAHSAKAELEEGSHSGLVRTLGKRVWGQTHQEFESLTLRQKGFCKRTLSASLRSAANSYWIFGEKETDLSMKGKRNFFINFFIRVNKWPKIRSFLLFYDLF